MEWGNHGRKAKVEISGASLSYQSVSQKKYQTLRGQCQKLFPSSKTWKMQGRKFLSHPRIIHLFGLHGSWLGLGGCGSFKLELQSSLTLLSLRRSGRCPSPWTWVGLRLLQPYDTAEMTVWDFQGQVTKGYAVSCLIHPNTCFWYFEPPSTEWLHWGCCAVRKSKPQGEAMCGRYFWPRETGPSSWILSTIGICQHNKMVV